MDRSCHGPSGARPAPSRRCWTRSAASRYRRSCNSTRMPVRTSRFVLAVVTAEMMAWLPSPRIQPTRTKRSRTTQFLPSPSSGGQPPVAGAAGEARLARALRTTQRLMTTVSVSCCSIAVGPIIGMSSPPSALENVTQRRAYSGKPALPRCAIARWLRRGIRRGRCRSGGQRLRIQRGEPPFGRHSPVRWRRTGDPST